MATVSQLKETFYGQPDEVPAPPAYCQCGQPLVRYEERKGYRSDNGLPDITTTYRCPKTLGRINRALLVHLLHDEYELDHFADWYWRKRIYG